MRGWGASGVAGPITPERVGEAESMGGFAMYAFFNPVAMRDNFFQAVLEHVLFRRLVLALRIDPSDCPGADASAAPDGLVRYDPDHQVVMGQSLGSYLAGMLAALDPGFDAAILTGAGGSWVEFPFGVETPVNLASLLSSAVRLPSVETLDRFHPVIAIFDLSCGPSDNTHYVDEILRRPRPGHEAPHVLVVEGDDDRFIGPDLQRALVSAVGVDLVGADVGPADRRIEDRVLLAGGRRRDPPVRENVATPLGPRTAGVVRWLPDAEGAGHYVTFQIDGPQHQYACFLETLYETGIPTIVAGTGSRTSACH
jgi:pimeloyl-ACP methyl ester carboxylesterase